LNDNKINDVLGNILNETETKNSELRQKERELWQESVELKYENLKKKKEEEEHVKSINLDLSTREEHIKKAQQDSKEYLEQAKHAIPFINDDFKKAVPFFGQNLILLAAKTGDGKSTTAANIAYNCILQCKKVLIITNEEKVPDVYNRITCLIKGWAYVNHDQFTEEQKNAFHDYMPILSNKVMVIDDNYRGKSGQTTTIEGVTALLDSLITNETDYDAIVLDYYQNVSRSIKHPYIKNWEIQEQLAGYLDQFKNKYLAPIVILAQLKTESEKKITFKEALEGRKIILEKASCAIKMIADRENFRTEWQIMKSRFNTAVGSSIFTGFDKGKYVRYTTEFRNQAELKKQARESGALLSKTFKGKKNEEE
jgi:replicative DNA helicase